MIALSFLPLIAMVALALGLGYFFWEAAVDGVRVALESFSMLNAAWEWLQNMGLGNLKTVLAPLVVIFAVTPVIVVLSLIAVAVMMTPALVSLAAGRG